MGHSSSWFGEFVAWLTAVGESAGNVLVYSSAYLAVVAMAEVAIAMALLSLPPSPAPIVLGLVTFAVYATDRLEDADTDIVSNPERVAFVQRYQGLLTLLATVAYGIAISLAVLGGPTALAITILPGVFWVLYATNWIPEIGLLGSRIKDVLVLNTTVVSLAWAVSLTFLPLSFADAPFTGTAMVVFAYFFLRSFVDTEIPNVRDIESDRSMGVNTLPVVFGVERTKRALYGIDFITLAIIAYAAIAGSFGTLLAIPLVVGVAYSMCLTTFVGRYGETGLLAVATELEYFIVALLLIPAVSSL